MSASSRRAGRVLVGLLLASGLAVLSLMLLRGFPQSPSGAAPEAPPTPSATPQSAEGALLPVPTIDPTLAAIVRPSLPQEWAAAVSDKAAQTLIGAGQAARADTLSLWENGLSGPFTRTDGQVLVGGQVISPDERLAIEIVLPAPSEPGDLISIGSIERAADNTLTLHLSTDDDGSQSVRTLSAGLRARDVLATLVEEADSRGLLFSVAYWEMPNERATLALIAVQSIAELTQSGPRSEPTASATSSPGTPLPPTPTVTPSPTLAYLTDIRRAVETGLLPLIQDARHAPERNRQAYSYYAQHHSWIGVLTWETTQGEPAVAGRLLNLDPAIAKELRLFGLTTVSASSEPMTAAFLDAAWDGNGTTVTVGEASQWYYGFRLSEIVHWLTVITEERGGQLVVAYDRVGSYRALTVIDFQPLPLSPDN